MSTDSDARNSSGWSQRLGEWFDDFFGIDLRTLAVVRIGLAAIVLMTLAYLVGDIEAFFTDAGVYPTQGASEFSQRFHRLSLHALSGSYGWQLFLFALQAIFALMLLVGYRTRLSSLATWLLMASLFNRIHMTGHRADTLLCLLLLWGALTPWGARFSIDAICKKSEQLPERIASLGTAGLIAQMPLVYLLTFIAKIPHDAWISEFNGVHYALFPEYVTPVGEFVAAHQPYVLSQFASVATLVLQGLGPILIFCPLLLMTSRSTRRRWLDRFRLGAFAAYGAFQAVLLATVAVGLFPLISIVGLLPVIPGSWWNRGRWPGFWSRWCQRIEAGVRRRISPSGTAPKVKPPITIEAVALSVWMLSLVSAAESAGAYKLDSEVRSWQRSVHILQNWAMFHNPPPGVSHYIAEGTLGDGRRLDLFQAGGPVDVEASAPVRVERPSPPRSSSHYAGYRWRLLMWSMSTFNPPPTEHEKSLRSQYLAYVCRVWNEVHDGDQRLQEVTLHHLFYEADSPPMPPSEQPRRAVLDSREC